MTMYCCLEGIKGSGKSTVFALVCQQLASDGEHFSMVCPTRPKAGFSLAEQAFRWLGNDCPDPLAEHVYAKRSDHHWACRDRASPLLIGDRSILTSYATRFDPEHPAAAIQRVNRRERLIALPDIVFLLEIDSVEAGRRIAKRPERAYGRHDESPARLEQTAQAYRHLAQHGTELGLASIDWQMLDARRDPQDIALFVLGKIRTWRMTRTASECIGIPAID